MLCRAQNKPLVQSNVATSTSTGDSLWACQWENCNSSFTTEENLFEHTIQVHSRNGNVWCKLPSHNISLGDSVRCLIKTTRKSHMEDHLVTHFSNNIKPKICKICGEGQRNRQGLSYHMKKAHPNAAVRRVNRRASGESNMSMLADEATNELLQVSTAPRNTFISRPMNYGQLTPPPSTPTPTDFKVTHLSLKNETIPLEKDVGITLQFAKIYVDIVQLHSGLPTPPGFMWGGLSPSARIAPTFINDLASWIGSLRNMSIASFLDFTLREFHRSPRTPMFSKLSELLEERKGMFIENRYPRVHLINNVRLDGQNYYDIPSKSSSSFDKSDGCYKTNNGSVVVPNYGNTYRSLGVAILKTAVVPAFQMINNSDKYVMVEDCRFSRKVVDTTLVARVGICISSPRVFHVKESNGQLNYAGLEIVSRSAIPLVQKLNIGFSKLFEVHIPGSLILIDYVELDPLTRIYWITLGRRGHVEPWFESPSPSNSADYDTIGFPC